MIEEKEKRLSDKEWFWEVYEAHRPRIYKFIVGMTDDPSLSDDLTQEVFQTLWRKRKDVRDKRHVGGWLSKTAINVTISDKRKAYHREVEFCEDRACPAEPDQMQAFMECLPVDMKERDKMLLFYRVYCQYPFKEIGELLNWTTAGARMRFCRLRRELKGILEESL